LFYSCNRELHHHGTSMIQETIFDKLQERERRPAERGILCF